MRQLQSPRSTEGKRKEVSTQIKTTHRDSRSTATVVMMWFTGYLVQITGFAIHNRLSSLAVLKGHTIQRLKKHFSRDLYATQFSDFASFLSRPIKMSHYSKCTYSRHVYHTAIFTGPYKECVDGISFRRCLQCHIIVDLTRVFANCTQRQELPSILQVIVSLQTSYINDINDLSRSVLRYTFL